MLDHLEDVLDVTPEPLADFLAEFVAPPARAGHAPVTPPKVRRQDTFRPFAGDH